MQVDDYNDRDDGKSWEEILNRRSPEGRAVVLLLNQAEQACIEAERRVTAGIRAHRDIADEFVALEAAMAEVDRMRDEVYRMARQ